MPDPTTDILTGINPSLVLDMEADTKARYQEIFKPLNLGAPDMVMPKLPSFQAGTVKPGQNINIPVDKTSYEYQLAKQENRMRESAQEYPDTFIKPADVNVPQSLTNRYINEDDGYRLDRDNEDFYAHKQRDSAGGSFKEIMKAIFVKLPTYVATKLGTGLGYVAGLLDPTNWGKNYIASAADNGMAKFFSGVEDDLKNKYLTTFKYAVDENKGFFHRAVTDLSFWTEDFTDGAAFLASAFVPGAIISKLGWGAKLAKLLQTGATIENDSNLLRGLASAAKNYGDKALTTAVNTASESMFEAAGVKEKVFKQLMDTGKYSESEAKDISAQKAKNSFLWNIAALSFSNMWETNLFYKAMGKNAVKSAGEGVIEKGAAGILEDLTVKAVGKYDKLKFLGKKFAEGVLVEGPYEENIQLAIQRKNEGSGTYDGHFQVLGQMLKQTKDAIAGNDKEAAENIGMGSMIGAIFGTGTSIKTKEYSKERMAAEKMVASLNYAKNNWTKITSDIYSLDENGKIKEDKAKVAALLLTQHKISEDLENSEALNNKTLKSIARKELFSGLVLSHLNQGTEKVLFEQLNDLHNMKDSDLVKLGFDPSAKKESQINEYINYANKVANLHKSVTSRIKGDENIDVYKRSKLLDLGSRNISLEQEGAKLETEFGAIESDMGHSSTSDYLVNNLNFLLSKMVNEKFTMNNSTGDVKTSSEKRHRKYEKEYNKVTNENKDGLEKLKYDDNGFLQYEDPKKNKHILIKDLLENLHNRSDLSNTAEYVMDQYNDILDNPRKFRESYEKEISIVEEHIAKAKEAEVKEKQATKEKVAKTPETEKPVQEDKKDKPAPVVHQQPVPDKEDGKEYTDEHKDKTYNEFVDRINQASPNNEIMLDIKQTLNKERHAAADAGRLTDAQDLKLLDLLEGKKTLGTIKTDERIPLFGEDGKLNQDALDLDDIEETADPEEELKETPVEKGEGFDPETNTAEDIIPNETIFSALANGTPTKTTTQEEIEIDGKYTGELDPDENKRFKQNFLRFLHLNKSLLPRYKFKVIQDSPNLPQDIRTKAYYEKGGKPGFVVAVTDVNNNILHFDINFNPSTEPTEGFRPLIYSFNKKAWKINETDRATLKASKMPGETAETMLEAYQREQEQQDLVRQLAELGIETPATIKNIIPGALRFGQNLLSTKTVLADQKYSHIHIPRSTKAYDPKNPGPKYLVTVDGTTLINGAAYVVTQVTDKSPYVYTRVVPDKITENTELFENINNLFNHTYTDKNQANNVKDYLKGLLFLGTVGRPTISVSMNDMGTGFEIAIIKDKKAMTPEEQSTFLAEQRINIEKEKLASPFDQYIIKDKKVTLETFSDYNDFIVSNSKTRSRNIDTPEGKKIAYINTYATFTFDDSIDTMRTKLAEAMKHPGETSVAETKAPPTPTQTIKKTESIEVNNEQRELGLKNLEDKYNPFPKNNESLTQEPLKPKRRQLIPDAEQEANRLADLYNKNRDGLTAKVTSEGGVPINTSEVSEVSKMLGHQTVIRIGNTINSEAYGVWRQSGIILFANAIEGTGYHEAWHEFSQMYLTVKQKQDLYNEVRKRNVKFTDRDGKKLSTQDATDLEVEEFMADDFRDYVLKDGKSRLATAPKRNNIFRTILNFLKDFFFGKVNIDSMYRNLRKGNLYSYKRSVNNAMWGKLNSNVVNKAGLEVFDNKKSAYFRGIVDVFVGEELNRRNLSIVSMNSSIPLASSIYNNVYNRIVQQHFNPLIEQSEAGTEVNNDLLTDLDTLTDPGNWTAFTNYHAQKSKLEIRLGGELDDTITEFLANVSKELDNDNSEDEDAQNENIDASEQTEEIKAGAENSDKLFDRVGNEIASLTAATPEVRAIIRMLPKMIYKDSKFQRDLDSNGFPRLNEYSHTWNNIARELADVGSYSDMYKKLLDSNLQQRIPEVVELLTRIPHPDLDHNASQVDTMTKFERDFDRAYVSIHSGLKTENGDFYFLEETKRNVEQIQKEFSFNFQSIDSSNPLMENDTVLVDEDGKNYINPEARLHYKMENEEDRDEFMQLIGFQFSDRTMENPNIRTGLPSLLAALQDNVNRRLEMGIKITDPRYELSKDVWGKNKDGKPEKILEGFSGKISGYIAIEAKYSTANPSMSYQTAEGDMIYALTLNSWLTRNAANMNTTDSFEDFIKREEMQHLNPKNNPNVKNSVFLNRMFDFTTGKRNKDVRIQVGNYNGLKVDTESGRKAYSTNSLNVRDKIVMDLNALLKAGSIEIMRTEASKTAYFIKLNSYGNDTNLVIPPERLSESFNSGELLKIVKGYLTDELSRMISADEVAANLPNYPIEQKNSAKEFHLFRDILNSNKNVGEHLKDKIKEDIKTLSAEETVKKHAAEIDDAVINFFNKELFSFKNLLNDEGISIDDLAISVIKPKDDKKRTEAQLLRAFLANSFILNVEYTKLFDGDTAYQAHYKDYFKRAKGAISTGISPTTSDFFVRHMQTRAHDTIAGFIGTAHLNDFKTTRSVVVKEDVRTSDYATHDILKNNLKKTNPELSDEQIDNLLGYNTKDPSKSKGYYGMKIGDGQGHITMDFYRQFLKSIGNWDDAQERMYQKELAWFRLNYTSLADSEYTADARKKDEDTLAKYKDAVAYFPPIKMQYNGPIKAKGTFAPVMDKFSVAVLVPSIIQGTQLEKQHLEMVKHGVGYSKFQSGTKKFMASPIETYTNDKFGMDLSNYQASVHFLENLKEQINTKSDIKQESIWGSQIRKLIEANLFSYGKSSEKNILRHEEYKNIIKKMHTIERDKLYNQLGLTLIDGYTQIDDLKKFIENIQKQVDFRDLNANVKDYIQYDKDTKGIKYPLEASLNKQAIQSMINGIIDSRLRKQKLNGDMLIQVSSSGFESNDFKYTKADATEVRKYGTNGLKFYDIELDQEGKPIKTKAMQVKVALVGGFEKLLNRTHTDGQVIETIDRLNELLKNEDWMSKNRQLVTMVGYRIPTQGHNSMEYMEVAEFLPPHAGSIVIPPAEIVAKSGSDFDIDKLSIFRPSFDSRGNLVDENTVKNLSKELNQAKYQGGLDKLMAKFNIKGKNMKALADVLEAEQDLIEDPEVENLKQEIRKISNSTKEIYSNKLIKLYTDILSDPEQYKSLITPNTTDLIKGVSLEIARDLGKIRQKDVERGGKDPYEGTQIFRYKTTSIKRETLTSAKSLMAIFAVNNTFSQLLHQANININSTYNTKSVFENVSRNTRMLLLSQEERAGVLVDGQINLSNKFAINGILKQEYFSQFINGTIDAPSDDFLGYVNLSYENAGVVTYLLHQGIPADRILRFINQPVMLKYYSELRRSKGFKSEIQGKILGDLLGRTVFTKVKIADNGEPQPPAFNATAFNDLTNLLLSYDTTPEKFYFSEKELKSNITGKFDAFLSKDENKVRQAVLFAYFISLQEQSQLFRNFQTILNFDTTKIQNGTSAEVLIQKEKLVIKNGLFSQDGINQIAKKSIISPFISNKLVVKHIAERMMPYAYNIKFTEAASAYIVNRPYLNKSKVNKIMRTMENDWIEYLVKSFGVIDGVSFGSYYKTLITGKDSLARQLITLRKKYPTLLDNYSFFNRLRQNISSKDDVKQQNIQLQRLFEDTADDQNRYTDEFRQLINFSDNRYTIEQQEEIKKFFKELAIMGFIQSGFNKSAISFQDVIPYEELSDVFRTALLTYRKEVAKYPDFNQQVIGDFMDKFKKNNPTLDSNKKKSVQSWRGKDYGLNFKDASLLQNKMAKEKFQNEVEKILNEKNSIIMPEFDEKGNVLLNSQDIAKINSKKTRAISFSTKPLNQEYVILDQNGENQTLVRLTLQGEYRSNLNEFTIEKMDAKGVDILRDKEGKPTASRDRNDFARVLGYDSFDDLVEDRKMLAFAAGQQTRYFYEVQPLIQAPAQAKDVIKTDLNDEPVDLYENEEYQQYDTKKKEQNIENEIADTRETTPDNIKTLPENGIFVFGSNAEGKHGKGAALTAKEKFGAKQGQAQGLQGQSYAIITKKDWRVEKSSTLSEIKDEILGFVTFAIKHPELKFYVTKIGTSLAGYTVEEIKYLFSRFTTMIPNNVILPAEYEVRGQYLSDTKIVDDSPFFSDEELRKSGQKVTTIIENLKNNGIIKTKDC